jgi:cytochrome c6
MFVVPASFKKSVLPIAVLAFALAFCPSSLANAQESAAPSSREQLSQYVAQLQKNPSDDDLRGKIIKLALTLDPKPAIPDDAAVAAAKGKTIFTNASSPDDLKAAAAAYADASNLAPWVPDYYYNEGLALEKAGQFDDAITALNVYLMAAPDASDTNDVRGRIEGIKYEKEKAANRAVRQTVAKSPQLQSGDIPASAENNGQTSPESLSGNWDCQSGCDSATVTVNGAIFNAVIEAEDIAPNTCAYDESGNCGRALRVTASGSISGHEITGTMQLPRMRDTRTNCEMPAVSESLTGTTSPDGKSISLSSSTPDWQTNAQQSIFGARCDAVNRTGDSPEFISLSRSSSASSLDSDQPMTLSSQAQLYKARCAPCHSANGSGSFVFGKAMGSHDLRSRDVQNMTDYQLAQIISDGKGRRMPAYGKQLKDTDIKGLVAYIRSLAK